MTIATRLDHYLQTEHIPFQTVPHVQSHSSLQSGVAAGIPLACLAKGVVLEDHQGHHVMAVLPANNKISLSRLNDELNASLHLVKEAEVYQMFTDCTHGAVPPVGSPYHMTTVCDEALTKHDSVYIEAGDHQTLLKLSKPAFAQLMDQSKVVRFSSQVFH
uniref:aminoacyl-tRNA deacylase n=1 Tax=Thaumasiovibrio occultus TaxID=1891184 RepID=UPI000B34D45E|nr:YbaK/EbsC family protein [Thaumasiovibrio occultus]